MLGTSLGGVHPEGSDRAGPEDSFDEAKSGCFEGVEERSHVHLLGVEGVDFSLS